MTHTAENGAECQHIVSMNDGSTRPWYKVNRRLLPVKGIYFTFISAIGALIPFIPVYMKQLGFTSTETGILIGVMPFISFFVQPVFGAIADKTRKPKFVLICCLIFAGIFFGLLLLTPSKNGTCADVIIECDVGRTRIMDRQCIINIKNKSIVDDSELLNTHRKLEPFQEYIKQNLCTVSCNTFFTHSDLSHVCVSTDDSVKDCRALSNDSENGHTTDLNEVPNIYKGQVVRYDILNHKKMCQISSLNYTNSRNMACNNYTLVGCNLECNNGCASENADSNKTFWIFSILYLFANIFYAPITSLVDAIAYDILGEKRKIWGKQRLWGTIGFAFFGMSCTFIMDMLKRQTHSITDYSFSFYTFIGLCAISAIVVTTLDVSETLQCRRMLKNVTTLLRFPKVIGFLLVMTCIGALHFVFLGFLFWFLEDLGSNQIILGLCLVINSLSEIVILFSAGKIIKLIGHIRCLYIALLAYVVRFLSYSFLTSAWFVLPIELLHGVCFGLMYAAASSYASIISPTGMSATMQGLMAGLYFGFGRGISGLVTGKLFDSTSGLGERWTFRFYSFMALFVLIVYAFFNIVILRKTREAMSNETVEIAVSQPEAENSLPDEPFLSTLKKEQTEI